MFRLVKPEHATDAVRPLFAELQRQLGRVPNLYAAMANSPTALRGYLSLRDALQDGELEGDMHERIALRVAEINECDYCVAAHTFRGAKLGLSAADLLDTRRGRSADARVDAALRLVSALAQRRAGELPDALRRAADGGWSEAQIGEIVAHVALNVFSNAFKHVARPPLDFPAAPALAR
jgi:AhpD family alkylhydroperoxidase